MKNNVMSNNTIQNNENTKTAMKEAIKAREALLFCEETMSFIEDRELVNRFEFVWAL